MPQSWFDRGLLLLLLLSAVAVFWMTEQRRPDPVALRAYCVGHPGACVPDSLIHPR